jgi:hypothetical protein
VVIPLIARIFFLAPMELGKIIGERLIRQIDKKKERKEKNI